MKRPHKRFLSDFYDSIKQRAFPAIQNIENVSDMYLGRLRFDSLLSEIFVVVDTQLLDGDFFLTNGPKKLLKTLARREDEIAPIEVKCRANSLEDALLKFFKSQGSDRLRPFSMSILREDSQRTSVMKHLAKTSSEGVNSWRDIISILRESGIPTSEIERIKEGWSHWFEAENAGQVRIQQWDGGWHLDSALGSFSSFTQCLSSHKGQQLANWVWENRAYRSSIDEKINSVRSKWSKDEELLDTIYIQQWYNSGYNRTIASQHGCDTFESIDTSPAVLRAIEEYGIEDLTTHSSLDLPPDFLAQLGSIDNSIFHELCRTQKRHLEKWWNEGDADALKYVADYLVTTCCSSPPPKQSPLARISAAGISGGIGSIIGAVTNSIVGPHIGAVVGAMIPECILWYQGNLDNRPVKQIVQRIMKIAEERTITNGHKD
jgi:hypothetical protein